MDGLISRQAAIDALDGEITVTGRVNAEAVRGYANLVCDRIKQLPSAQPEQRWIPCSKKGSQIALKMFLYSPISKRMATRQC